MKNTNNGYLGQVSSLSNTQKSGVFDAFDVYTSRITDGQRITYRPGLSEPQNWPGANSDPYYDTVRIHVREPQGNTHIMRDYSGNNHDQYLVLDTVSRAVAPTFFGPRYQHWSALFGESGYIKLNENASQFQFGTGAFTIEFWIKRCRNDNTDHFIMGHGSAAGTTGGSGWAIYISSNNRIVWVNNTTGNTTVTGSSTLTVDDWIHLAFVRTSTATNDFRIYVDGTLDATGTCGNAQPIGSTSLYIGRDRAATASSFFGGMMSDLRITRSVIYTGNFVRPQQPLDMNVPNIVYHDSVSNRRFYTDTANSPSNIPVTLEGAQIVKVVDSPYFVENTKTPQAHGTHSAFIWSRQNTHKYLDLTPGTSLRLGSDAYTVEAWVYLNERASTNAICGKGLATNGWYFWVDSSQRLRFTSNSTELYNTGTVTSNYVGYGGWNHVAATRSGTGTNQFRLYVNGQLEYTGTDPENYRGTQPLYLFADRNGDNRSNGFFCGIRISKTSRYTANFSVESTAFIDSSMAVDANVSFLSATCGTDKLIPTQDWYIDYGRERAPQVRKGSEVRLGPHHPTSNSGFSWASTDGRNRVYMRSNGRVPNWARIGASTWLSADLGLRHGAGVRSDGTLWTWGDNGWGQLGHGDQMSRSAPTQVGTDSNWAQVSCGWANTVAVKTNGTLWIWGLNAHNQLGEGTGGHRLLPRQMGTDTNWEQAWFNTLGGVDGNQAPGVLARKTTGTIWGWGWNGWYIVGDATSTQRSTPTQGGNSVSTWRNIFVSHQGGHYAGIRTDNSLWIWGLGGNGKQGRGNTTDYSSPTQVGTTEWSWVALGRDFTIAIKTNGTLWAAGWGGYGQLGDNTGIERQTFVQIGTDTNWSKCYAGWYTAFVTKTTGGLWAMGMGISGQMGDGNQSQYWQPTQVSALNFNHNYPMRGNENSMMLVTNTGELYVAGTNKMFQLGTSIDSGFNWGTGDFSMEFWYRRNYDLDNLASNGLYTNYLFDARSYFTDRVDGNKNTWAIKNNHNNNNMEIVINNVSELMDRSSYGAASIGNWQHYVWQRVSGVMSLYANGRKVDEKFYPHNIIAHGNSITVGTGTTPYLHYGTGMNGLLSDIRINRGTPAYAVDGYNPDYIPVPQKPLTAITGTVFLAAAGPSYLDYSGTNLFYNEVRSDGNIDETEYYRDYNGIYILSHGPYAHDIRNQVEHNNITTGLIRPYGDTWDGTNQAESYSYHITPANQYPEYSWITRMVKPWTIEFWMWGHQSVQHYNSVGNHRKLYTATSSGHNGWEVWYGQANAAASGTTINATWGRILFRLWTANNNGEQIFAASSSKMYRAHGWNHVAVVFDPSASNKMGIFMNGERVGARTTALAGSTKVWNTYFMQNDTTGIGGIRISDIARYSPDSTSYTIPTAGYIIDNNTITCVNAESTSFQTDLEQGQLSYNVRPDFYNKKFGNGSFRFQMLDQSNGVVDRMYWAENSWRYYNLDMRHRDITMECWCSWWDAPLGSLQFNGSQGLQLPSSGTLNPTNGSVEFWIKASTSQPANPTIFAGNGATTSAITLNSGRIEFTIRRGGTHTAVLSKTSVTDNQWHHVVCVKYEQSATRSDGFVYVDGKLEGKSVTWTGSNAWSISTGTIGSNFNGLLCNFHFTTYREKYMSSWDRFGTALHQGFTTATFNPIPVNYHNPALSELDTVASDAESGKYPVPTGPLSRGNNTVLLLNAENVSIIQSPVGTVGSITGSGPWTATITGMSSTTGLVVGSALVGATNGTGALFGGTPTSVIVASVPSGTSITYTVTGGSAPVAGSILDIRTPGQVKDDSSNNWSIVPSIALPSRSSETPFYSGGSAQDFSGRPQRAHESGYGSTLFNHSGGPHVWRTEEGNWAFSVSSDFMYDITYPRRYFTVRTNTRVRNLSEGENGWQHVVLTRVNQNWILYVNGVEVGRKAASYIGGSDRPIYTDAVTGDYSSCYVYLGTHSSTSWWRSWTGCIQDFRVSSMARYDTKVINGVPTMVHRGTNLPALPTGLHPIGM